MAVLCGLSLSAIACDAAFPGASDVDPVDEPIRDDNGSPPMGGSGEPDDSSGGPGGSPSVEEPKGGSGGSASGGDGGGASGGTAGVGGVAIPSAGFPALPTDPCGYGASRTVEAKDTQGLKDALATSTPGTRISLAPGTYSASFVIARSGRPGNPIVVCGPRTAILQSGSSDDGIHIKADHIVLSGFQVRGGLRGVLTDGSEGVLISALEVHSIGQEAIHLRAHSRNNMIRNCRIHNTGVSKAQFGEGIYVGSAVTSWAKHGGGANQPDRSDNNFIINNNLGPDVRAEHIDVKEGTTGGTIQGNVFDGRGMSGEGYADSWIDVKGSQWLIANNEGKSSLKDGFQVHVVADGWGNGNTFRGNAFDLAGSGYGVWIEKAAQNNKVTCDNRIIGNAKGIANIACQ